MRRGRLRLVALIASASLLLALPAAAQTRPGPPVSAERGFIESTLNRMSLEERVGQLFWTHVYGSSADDTSMAAQNQATYGVDTPAEVVEKYDLGGVIYFAWSGNVDSPEAVATLSNGLQEVATSSASGVPLTLTIDQEGGLVQRILEPATVWPGNMALGATRSTELAAAQGAMLADELRAVGINANFAPVVDVNTNPLNPVIGIRSYGEDPDLVSALGGASVTAMQSRGVSATPKHFPGHGDTEVDSHYGLPIVTYDRSVLDEVHLPPFQAAIDAGADMVMTAHVIIEAIDPDLPATLSHDVLTGVLRGDLGFEGVIVTDAMEMQAIVDHWGAEEAAVMALQAGADVLLMPQDMDAATAAVLEAVRSGEIASKDLDAKVRRVLQVKYDRGLFDDPFVDESAVGGVVGNETHLETALEISRRAATVIHNDDVLPLDAGAGDVVVVGPAAANVADLSGELQDRGLSVTTHTVATNPNASERAAAVAAASDADLVVAATWRAWANPGQAQLARDLAEGDAPVLAIGTRDAYDIAYYPQVDAYVATYGTRAVNHAGAGEVLFGETEPTGLLPVTIPTADGSGVLYPFGHGLGY
ncbi:glycoside hydrolase family 3 protein [Nitriliruptor alkaliphilus]|uniref:glycoside hydrolase family 3 protein n=1 Tax=Nitriliruptor alkaliphilus TaxID=427918 RepID=UPI000695A744|nr:glycoside hydrolase family 3 protein [Nitriliruptor alkaliphilus]